jgi:hypothetical protein
VFGVLGITFYPNAKHYTKPQAEQAGKNGHKGAKTQTINVYTDTF